MASHSLTSSRHQRKKKKKVEKRAEKRHGFQKRRCPGKFKYLMQKSTPLQVFGRYCAFTAVWEVTVRHIWMWIHLLKLVESVYSIAKLFALAVALATSLLKYSM